MRTQKAILRLTENKTISKRSEVSSTAPPTVPRNYPSFPKTHWKHGGENLGWFLVCESCGEELTNDPIRADRLLKTHFETVHRGEH